MKIGIDIDDTTFLTVKSMLKYADKTIQKLKKEENTIHFITARLMNIKNCNTEAITKRSLDNFNIPYDGLNFITNM